jgi:hypothetical protein
MTRRTIGLLLVAVLVCAGAGCGVPESSDPVRLGTPRQAAGQPPVRRELPLPDTRNPSVFLRRYLAASAWSNSKGAVATKDTSDQVNKFLDENHPASTAWQPGEQLKLVRVTYPDITEPVTFPLTVRATVEDFGALDSEGGVVDDPVRQVREHVFTLVDPGDGRLRLRNPLPGLVFDVDQLGDWYQPRTIYFWGSGPDAPGALVPEVRYLPSVIGPDRAPTEILRWLKDGPSDWLKPAVLPVDDSIRLQDNAVVDSNSRITINLDFQAAGLGNPVFRAYYIQARWSLSNGMDSPVDIQLQVVGRPQTVNVNEVEYRSANPVVRAFDARDDKTPPSYCVRDGQVRPARTQTTPPPVPVLDPEHNRDITRAAIAPSRRVVAYVRQEGAGTNARQRLVIATTPASGADTVQPAYSQSGQYRGISRPVYLPQSDDKFLVLADNVLYLASVPGNGTVAMAALSGNEPMTAIAIAPDGRRLAYVQNNRVFVATLSAEAPGQLLLAQPRREIRTTLARQNTVGWLSQDRLVVGGKATGAPGRDSPLVDVSVDGTRPQRITRSLLDANLEVDALVAVADSPTSQPLRYLMMLEAATNTSYEVFGTTLQPLPCNPPSSPAPSQGPTGNVAPFFEG